MELAGTYSKHSGLLDRFANLRKQVEADGPRQAKQSPRPRSSGGPKKHLTADETSAIVAKYEAGVSMAQLKVEHHMAKRTVARVLREAGVLIRPRGGPASSRQLSNVSGPNEGSHLSRPATNVAPCEVRIDQRHMPLSAFDYPKM